MTLKTIKNSIQKALLVAFSTHSHSSLSLYSIPPNVFALKVNDAAQIRLFSTQSRDIFPFLLQSNDPSPFNCTNSRLPVIMKHFQNKIIIFYWSTKMKKRKFQFDIGNKILMNRIIYVIYLERKSWSKEGKNEIYNLWNFYYRQRYLSQEIMSTTSFYYWMPLTRR